MPFFRALIIVLLLTGTNGQMSTQCWPSHSHRDALIPIATDCSFILAHLPADPETQSSRSNTSLDSNSPFTPILRIRHGTCALSFSADILHNSSRRFSPINWRDMNIPRLWREMCSAARDLVSVCGEVHRCGETTVRHPLDNGGTLWLSVSSWNTRTMRHDQNFGSRRQKESLEEALSGSLHTNSNTPVGSFWMTSYEV